MKIRYTYQDTHEGVVEVENESEAMDAINEAIASGNDYQGGELSEYQIIEE